MLSDLLLCAVPPKDYYAWQKIPLNQNVRCPLPSHEDKNPSFKVFNISNGAAKCHASTCGFVVPHYIAFHSRRHKLGNDEVAALDIYENLIGPVESNDRVEMLHKDLLSDKPMLSALMRERGLTLETIKTWKLGFDIHNKRISIPIPLDGKHFVSFRYWLPREFRTDDDAPKIYHDKGTLPVLFNLFRARASISKSIFFTGSELDCIRMWQDGYASISSITGEGTFEPRWAPMLKGRHIILALGSDHPEATKKLKDKLLDMVDGVTVSEVKWPKDKKGAAKDYTEFRNAGLISETWLRQYEQAAPTGSAVVNPTQEAESVDFSRALDSVNIGVPVKFRAIICGVSNSPYSIPSRFEVNWKTIDEDKKISKVKREYVVTDVREYLYFVDKPEGEWFKFFRNKFKFGKKAMDIEIQGFDHVNLHECTLSPETSGGTESKFSIHEGYSINTKPEPNINYEVKATPVSNPNGHNTLLLITALTDLGTSNKKLSKEELDHLSKVCSPLIAKTKEELDNVTAKLCAWMAAKHTKIRGRADLHLTGLLSLLCPIGFTMEGEVQRGWINTLIAGDSRTGKSQTLTKMQKLLRAGEFCSAENCTVPGLVGAIQQGRNGNPIVVWARIPRNHNGALIIEELSGMPISSIAQLSDIRSSGVARIDKWGMSHLAPAKCRLICLANPRGGISMSRFTNAIRVIQGLIGAPEDIARFDIILTLSSNEVSIDVIHDTEKKTLGNFLSDEALHLLTRWVWSLNPDQVYLSKQAEAACRDAAVKLSEKYHWEVPIFKVEDGRFKLARIACGFAILGRSFDSKGKVFVKTMHVEKAMEFLDSLWSKKSFGYDLWSSQFKKGVKFDEVKVRAEIQKLTAAGEPYVAFCSMLADRESVSNDDLADMACVDRNTAARISHIFFRAGVSSRIPDPNNPHSKPRWNVTPDFRKWLVKEANGLCAV